jgi:tetraacyldisaccharide 4'-kinase
MFEQIWKKIIRREPYTFWDLPAFVLWLVSLVYRAGYRLLRLTSGAPTKVAVPVISVGNITVGGSGKTPLVGCLAKDLMAEGIRVGIVSSGYRRRNREPFLLPGYKVQELDVAQTGDEIKLLAHQLPEARFSVHPHKVEAARLLANSGEVDVIIVDDGFQHSRLARDIDLVAYDAALDGRLLKPFPYGMLREPKTALARADVIVITRAKLTVDMNAIKRELRRISPNASLYHAAFHSENIVGRDSQWSVKYLNDKSVFLFAGIGNFRALERQVSALCADLDYALELSDHQRYDQELLQEIHRQADHFNSDLVLTTFKDWVKIGDFDFGREFYYLDLAVDLDPGEEKLLAEVMSRLGLSKRKADGSAV